MIQHPEQLKDPFLSPSVTQGVVIDNKIGVDPAVVPSDVQAPGSGAVLLDYVNSRHEASYSYVVVRMLQGCVVSIQTVLSMYIKYNKLLFLFESDKLATSSISSYQQLAHWELYLTWSNPRRGFPSIVEGAHLTCGL